MRFLLSWVLAAIVICATVAGYYYYYRVDEEVRRHVQRMLAEQYPDYSVVVGSARLVQGEGVRLSDVSIARPAGPEMKQRSVLLFCDEVLLKCNPSLQQLLQGRTDVPHVRLRGLVLRPLREPDGSWNVEDLIALRIADRPMPTVTIDDAHVEVVDRRLSPPSILTLDNLSLTMIPRSSEVPLQDDEATASRGGPHAVAIRANFTNEHCREVLVRGWVNPETLAWSLEGTVADLRFTPELLRALPAEAWPRLAGFSGLRAHANLGFTVNLDPTAKNGPRFAVEGQLIDGRLESTRHLAIPVTEMTAISVRCDNDGWQVKDLNARYGAARITLSAKSQNSISHDAITLSGTVQNLNITPELIHALPQPFQAQWRKFKPLGLVDAGFQAVRQRGRWWLATDTQFRSVSLICEKFKYPLVRAHGTVKFRQNETLVADLWASADQMSDQTPIHLLADIRRPGPNFQGDIYVTSHDWLRLNKSLTSPLAPVVQRILGDLEARGHIKFDAHLRRDEHGKFHKDITIDVEKGWLRHKSFPYPLDQVQGRVHVEEQQWTFENFQGQNDSCWVKCRGRWLPGTSTLNLNFEATDIPCDAELREALRGGPRLIWRSLRPTGIIDHVRIDVMHQTGMPKPKFDISVNQWRRPNDPERRSLVIQPTWFPIRMNQVSGTVVYNRDGSCQLQNLQAVHESSHRSVDINAHGAGVFRNDGTWEVNLERLTADGLETTPELLSALPHDLGTALTELRFAGQLSVDGNMWFAGNSDPQTPITSNWSLLVNVDDGKLQAGNHNIEHLFGQFSIGGGLDGKGWSNAGRVRFDSLMYKGVHITEFEGPWRMDPDLLIFGAGAATNATPLDARHVRARLFGGVGKASGFVSIGPDHEFQVETIFSDVDLAELAKEMATPSKITGVGYARLRLEGDAQVTQTLRGEGSVRLLDANLAKLPAIISLVNELRIRDPRASVFSSSDIRFNVDGQYVNFEQFDLHGESLTLKGQGDMSLDHPPRIALKFYTILGGENRWLPSVRPWLSQASQQFLQIMVTGALDELRWTREVLPGLNETLQQLFPEQTRTK